MKIVVLDGYTLNPGDLKWDSLLEFGEVVIYDRTKNKDILKRSWNAEILFTNKTPIGPDIINKLPNIKYIGVLATGYNLVDVEAAKKRGIIVTNIPEYGSYSVAQMTFALLLELCLHVQRHSDSVRGGKWTNSVDFCYWESPLIELAGKTIGIIGYGNIGRKVDDISTSFGMNIIATNRSQMDQSHRKNFKWGNISEVLKSADIISIHCPLTPETKNLINKATLERMKKSAFLLNTSRGEIINEKDLANALNNGSIAGAGLDVLSIEPPLKENPLLKAKNCIITPHIAWATKEARTRLMDNAINNLNSYINGTPINVINL